MIPSYSMLNSRMFGVPDQVCTLYAKTLNNTNYYINTSLGTSTTSYSYTNESKLYGQGQVTGSSGNSYTFIRVPLMTTLKKQQRI